MEIITELKWCDADEIWDCEEHPGVVKGWITYKGLKLAEPDKSSDH